MLDTAVYFSAARPCKDRVVQDRSSLRKASSRLWDHFDDKRY
ncbi:MAG TPA: hypothetical protein VNN80_03910 [Polyangiaceae bacterium]|jgi:hypothetical protein|nr:hypothetical protein [Polyangiaceae bacterium]